MSQYILLFILMLASLRCTVQIDSSICGLSIGSSTKQQVKSVINQKGFSIETEPDGAYCIKYPKGVKSGGEWWTYISFTFVNGLLCEVWFQNNEVESISDISANYNRIKRSLDEKYSKYKSYGGKRDDGSVYSDYWDETTTLSVSLHTYNGVKFISLVYQNDKLNSLRKENEKNEL